MNPYAIAEISAFPVSYPLPPDAQPGMGTGRIVRRDAVVVKVVTADGTVGWGECFHARSHMAIATLINAYLNPLVQGMDATAAVDVWSKVYNYHLAGYGAGAACYIALSGIDIALWDIRGKVAGMPLYRLLGGSRRRVRAYAGGLSLGFEEPARLVERIRALAEAGYGAVKLRVGDTPEKDIDRMCGVRMAFPDMEIMTDANTAYSLAAAQRVIPAMDELRIGWLEEPFPMDDRNAYKLASRLGDTPLAAGENHFTRFEFNRVIDDGHITILQPDLSKAGGVTEVLRIAAMASAWKLPIHPHSSMTGLNMAATIHFLAAIDNAGYFEGDASPGNLFRDTLVDRCYELSREGTVNPIDRPGIGVEVDEGFIAAHPFIEGPNYAP